MPKSADETYRALCRAEQQPATRDNVQRVRSLHRRARTLLREARKGSFESRTANPKARVEPWRFRSP